MVYGQRKDTSGLANALDWKGIIQEERGDLNGAIESLDHALSVAKGLEDRGLLFYIYLDRASVNQKMVERYVEEHTLDKGYSAADRAKRDYKRALAVAEALGWKGLAQQTAAFMASLELRWESIKAEESKKSDGK